jgi:hypothetical protein
MSAVPEVTSVALDQPIVNPVSDTCVALLHNWDSEPDPFDAAKNDGALSEAETEKLPTMPAADLHLEVVAATKAFRKRCGAAHWYALNRLVPLCEEIRKRYKMQGVAAKDRPNARPTVAAYFESIGLNYGTVRNWISDWKLRKDMFETPCDLGFPMLGEDDALDQYLDLQKIKKLTNKIRSIAKAHGIDADPAVEVLMRTVSPRLGGPEWPDPALYQAAVLGPQPQPALPKQSKLWPNLSWHTKKRPHCITPKPGHPTWYDIRPDQVVEDLSTNWPEPYDLSPINESCS